MYTLDRRNNTYRYQYSITTQEDIDIVYLTPNLYLET